MRNAIRTLRVSCLLSLWGASASAELCDYRLSSMWGEQTSVAVATSGVATGSAGMALNMSGLYTLVHSVTGLTMVGSTAAGSSAAGTVGIIGGTSGLIGTATAAALAAAPAAAVIGIGTAATVSVSETLCYFADERITDYATVFDIIDKQIDVSNDDRFLLIASANSRAREDILIVVSDGMSKVYEVSDLYIVNGIVMHRDWFLNTNTGLAVWR